MYYTVDLPSETLKMMTTTTSMMTDKTDVTQNGWQKLWLEKAGSSSF